MPGCVTKDRSYYFNQSCAYVLLSELGHYIEHFSHVRNCSNHLFKSLNSQVCMCFYFLRNFLCLFMFTFWACREIDRHVRIEDKQLFKCFCSNCLNLPQDNCPSIFQNNYLSHVGEQLLLLEFLWVSEFH